MIKKIISGGQTGVDRAALDAAIQLHFPYGGWCPKGRIDEINVISTKYKALKEITGEFQNVKENFDSRTKHNIRDSDGTLIIVPRIPLPNEIKDGTLFTIEEVKNQNKIYILIDLTRSQQNNIETITNWIEKHNIKTPNIAGPRESSYPGIYHLSFKLLEKTLTHLQNHC